MKKSKKLQTISLAQLEKKMGIKRVNAWAIIGKNGKFFPHTYCEYDIFPSKEVAKLRKHSKEKIVPCTIIYKIPKK